MATERTSRRGQVEFPPMQRHSRNFELLMIGICPGVHRRGGRHRQGDRVGSHDSAVGHACASGTPETSAPPRHAPRAVGLRTAS
jgi:hypothetical protein